MSSYSSAGQQCGISQRVQGLQRVEFVKSKPHGPRNIRRRKRGDIAGRVNLADRSTSVVGLEEIALIVNGVTGHASQRKPHGKRIDFPAQRMHSHNR